MLKNLAIGAVALALCAPAGAALAHDDEYGSFDYYSQHAQDHQEHGDFHGDESAAHAEAHERGLYSPGEHAYWHERARQAHDAFHEDHPGTWHDHYGWRRHRYRQYYNGYSGYGNGGY